MVGDGVTGDSLLPDSSQIIPTPPLPTELSDKIREFFAEGWPTLESVFYELRKLDLPPEVQIVAFPMVGAYLHTVAAAINDHNIDIMTAHAIGLSSVMGNPAVTSFIQEQLSSIVGGAVGEMVG